MNCMISFFFTIFLDSFHTIARLYKTAKRIFWLIIIYILQPLECVTSMAYWNRGKNYNAYWSSIHLSYYLLLLLVLILSPSDLCGVLSGCLWNHQSCIFIFQHLVYMVWLLDHKSCTIDAGRSIIIPISCYSVRYVILLILSNA